MNSFSTFIQKNKVETSVVKPLSSLLLMFQGPVKVMKKRYDKLLDYESTSSRIKGLRESEITKAVNFNFIQLF